MTRRRPELIPEADGDAMRWRLEIPGTSPLSCRALEAAVDEIGWTRLQTTTMARQGVTRVYIVTDAGESAQHIGVELAEHGLTTLPKIGRLEPTTWEAVRSRIHATQDARVRAGGQMVVPQAG